MNLFSGWKELKSIINAFHYGDTQGGDFFNSKIESIYQHFLGFNDAQIEQLKEWYKANNNIEQLCDNNPAVVPVTYQQLELFNKPLSDEIKSFFKKLYGDDILALKAVRDKIGKIDDHYDQFMHTNTKGKCPFCGLSDVKGVHHSKREAYDHYLPKGIYPFNSINFYNLAPMCNECNSSYKLAKDPLNDGIGDRRRSFYVYSNIINIPYVAITLASNDINNLTPTDINLSMTSATHQEHVDTWMDVYGLDERYKAKCISETDGKYWYTQILEEAGNYGKTPKEALGIRKTQATKYPFSDTNFLRKPFLEACESVGLFDAS
ncbi:MAG: hypothetical protein V7721_06545 [Porticoccaceae bacterium]